MPDIISVSELTRCVREVLEGEFPLVWVRGQAGTVSRPGSGHIYFNLKDDGASLNVVWFRSNQTAAGGTAPAELSTGLDVLCAGRLTVYGPRGVYQLVAELVQSEGVGRLHLQFEALKQKLAGEGLFASERKRPLPTNPRRVAVITAPSGAALRDFLQLSTDRGWGASIRIYPSLVQGEGAEQALTCALEEAGLEGWAEIVVLIRGGGSLEDLWSFNTEPVARAIADTPIPVLTGIGHEIDTTIADLVADARASTPSHAAQILWPDRATLMQRIDELSLTLGQTFEALWQGKHSQVRQSEQALSWLSPARNLQRLHERAQVSTQRLLQAGTAFLAAKEGALADSIRRMAAVYPSGFWELRRSAIQHCRERLFLAVRSLTDRKEEQTRSLKAQLQALDPERPLDRGFALVSLRRDGSLVRSPGQVRPGEAVNIRLRQGEVPARIEPFDNDPQTE